MARCCASYVALLRSVSQLGWTLWVTERIVLSAVTRYSDDPFEKERGRGWDEKEGKAWGEKKAYS